MIVQSLRPCIARAGEVAFVEPSRFASAKLYGFVVDADPVRVHEVLTRYIGRPSLDLGLPVDVRGTNLGHVLFVFIDSDRHQGVIRADPEPAVGQSRRRQPADVRPFKGFQREQLFAVLVLGYRSVPEPGLVLFAPYVYASESPGWRAEREIYGYPQQHGRVEVQTDGSGDPRSLRLRSRAIGKFEPNAMSVDQTILRVERKVSATPSSSSSSVPFVSSSLAEVLIHALDVGPVKPQGQATLPVFARPRLGATAADLLFYQRFYAEPANRWRGEPMPLDCAQALSRPLPMLFLKQFRDILHSDRACYQAIVEAELRASEHVTATYLEEFVLTLADVDSAPIRHELGIPTGPLDVKVAFRLEIADLTLENARVISNPYWNPAFEVSAEDEASRLPRYVDRGGEAVWRQPSLLYGARIYGFGIKVPNAQQQAILDECINSVAAASSTQYGPRKFILSAVGLDVVMLMFVEYARVTSATDDDSRLGGTKYREFLAMQLAMLHDDEFPELDWFIPFIYLDADSPRLAGREIYGYPKQLGKIADFERYDVNGLPIDPPRRLELRTAALRRHTDQRAAQRSLVRVEGPLNPPAILRNYDSADDMLGELLKGCGGEQAVALAHQCGLVSREASLTSRGSPTLNALVAANIGNVFLKEFRDCTHPGLACYQAVCKTDTVPGRFHGGGSLDPSDYRIIVNDLASEPLLKYIRGAAPGAQETITPVFAYWLDVDVELTNGRVVANPYEEAHVPDRSPHTIHRGRRGPQRTRQSRQREAPARDFAGTNVRGETV